MNDSDDIVKEFLVESYENLDRLDRDLIMLEKNPNDREVLEAFSGRYTPSRAHRGFCRSKNWEQWLTLAKTCWGSSVMAHCS